MKVLKNKRFCLIYLIIYDLYCKIKEYKSFLIYLVFSSKKLKNRKNIKKQYFFNLYKTCIQ